MNKTDDGDKPDLVNSPPHYTQGSVECIDALRACMTEEEFSGFLRGNVLKYLWRVWDKGQATENIAKAEWYLARLKDIAETRAEREAEATEQAVNVLFEPNEEMKKLMRGYYEVIAKAARAS